jgi:hypothetical protein
MNLHTFKARIPRHARHPFRRAQHCARGGFPGG